MPLRAEAVARHMVGAVQRARVLYYRAASAGVEVRGAPLRCQPLHCHGRGIISFGQNVRIGWFPSPGFLTSACFLDARGADSRIVFGDDVRLNNGFTAIAEVGRITIGSGARIGPCVAVFDSDFHGLDPQARDDPDATGHGDVQIGRNVFIGAGAIILKAVTIGDGAVIGAGSVVTRDVAPASLVAGNPARERRRR